MIFESLRGMPPSSVPCDMRVFYHHQGKENLNDEETKTAYPEQIVKKLRDAEAMKNAGQELAAVLQALEISESSYHPHK